MTKPYEALWVLQSRAEQPHSRTLSWTEDAEPWGTRRTIFKNNDLCIDLYSVYIYIYIFITITEGNNGMYV